MTRFLQRYYGWVLVWTAAYAWMSTGAFANSIELQPTLIFRVVNLAQMPNEVLIKAKGHVQWIYEDAGIQILWFNDADIQLQPVQNSVQLTITLIPESMVPMMSSNKAATGVAVSSNGQGSLRAYVFGDRVKYQARNLRQSYPALDRNAAEALVLGHVIAHETGHLMLPPGHSISGIMSSELGVRELGRGLRGSLRFTSDQRKLIRITILSQSGH